jgi:glycosyltransferase involved in cell wall biosynthesis
MADAGGKKNMVLYIGNFSFPFGNAAGKRVYGNGRLFRELGYEVIFVGVSQDENLPKEIDKTREEYDGFTYYNFPYPKGSKDWLKYGQVYRALVDFINSNKLYNKIELVIYYGSPSLSLFVAKLLKYCKRNNIKIAADCVDWLTPKSSNLIFNIMKWIDNTYQKAYLNGKSDGVIAISSYLSNYYRKNGRLTVIIPPLSIDHGPIGNSYNQNGYKIISYAGAPFKKGILIKNCNNLKDRIDKIIELFCDLKKCSNNFILNIYGFTRDEYLQSIPSQRPFVENLGSNIVFHGYMQNTEIIPKINKSDFTILLRDVNRDTTAGFPTKVSESISSGTPVITNMTSDIDRYIIEGRNGFYLSMQDLSSSLSKLKRIICLTEIDMKKLRQNNIEDAPFYYKKYVKAMKEFLATIDGI